MPPDTAPDPLVDSLLRVLKGFDQRWQQTHQQMLERIIALEQKALQPVAVKGEKGDPGEPGRDGKDADPTALVMLQADVLEIRETLAHQLTLENIVKAIPTPKDGKDGVSVDPADVRAMVLEEVTKAVSAMPVPKDGQSVTVADVEPLITQEVQKAVNAIPVPKDGKDGVSALGALLSREGHLVITLSDGTTKDIGQVVGRDGRDVDPQDVERTITELFAAVPKPKDGQDGKDGLGFDEMTLAFDPTRGYQARFSQGERVKDFPLSVPYDAGIYQKGTTYPQGACVTWANSYWLATAETHEVPGNGATAWRMIARGIQGKAGPKGERGDRGERGPQGPPGPARY